VDQIIIRRVATADMDAIAALWQDLVAYHQSLDEALPAATPDGARLYAKRIEQRLSDPYTCAFIAEDQGRVIAFVLGMVVDLLPDIFAQEPGGFLADIYVEPAYRRRGVGRALVAALRTWFAEQNVHYFDWHVAARNPEGLAFWRSIGGRDMMVRMRAIVEEDEQK
jgi:ribosomal protein S18 acetylase RimI-like enzyme